MNKHRAEILIAWMKLCNENAVLNQKWKDRDLNSHHALDDLRYEWSQIQHGFDNLIARLGGDSVSIEHEGAFDGSTEVSVGTANFTGAWDKPFKLTSEDPLKLEEIG